MTEIIKDKITWYDVRDPNDEDVEKIKDAFRLHPILADELKGPSARGKVEFHDSYVYLVVHFPFYDAKLKTSRPVEIDIVASNTAIATIRYEDFPPLEEFATKCEAKPGFNAHCLGDTPAHFIYRLFEHLFEYALRELKHIDEKLSDIGGNIFRGKEKEMIRSISYVKRDVLDFLRVIHPMGGVLESLAAKGAKLYGEDLKIYFSDLVGDFERVLDRVENYRTTIESLEDTNHALLSSRIDEVMRVLSVIAFLLAPFTVIGALFQVNTIYTPIIGRPGDWWIIFALMAAGSLALYLYFKKKGWL